MTRRSKNKREKFNRIEKPCLNINIKTNFAMKSFVHISSINIGPISSIEISDQNHRTVRMKTITKIKMALNNSRIVKAMMTFFSIKRSTSFYVSHTPNTTLTVHRVTKDMPTAVAIISLELKQSAKRWNRTVIELCVFRYSQNKKIKKKPKHSRAFMVDVMSFLGCITSPLFDPCGI